MGDAEVREVNQSIQVNVLIDRHLAELRENRRGRTKSMVAAGRNGRTWRFDQQSNADRRFMTN